MKLRTIAALAALPLLAACAPEIESTLYMADVLKVSFDGKPIPAPAILRVPQSSEDGCKEGLQNLIANLATLAPVTGKGKCIEQDGDQLAEIETGMLIVVPDTAIPEKTLFVLTVDPVDETTYELSFQITRPLDEIVKVLAANSDELQADFDPAKFIFTLTNDSQNPFEVTGNTVFIDGAPALPGTDPVTIGNRSSAELKFSDVASLYAEDGNSYGFATIVEAP